MTRAETLFWRHLRAYRVDGLGIRRQVPMGRYIADFVSHEARLVVELDGESHDFAARQRRDRVHDSWFNSQGYAVLRFTNEDVLGNSAGVVEQIRSVAASRGRGAPPSLSLPRKGGGNPRTDARRVTGKGGSS